jgi:hypothetical protein
LQKYFWLSSLAGTFCQFASKLAPTIGCDVKHIQLLTATLAAERAEVRNGRGVGHLEEFEVNVMKFTLEIEISTKQNDFSSDPLDNA